MPEGDALLDQHGCLYEPHVQGMRTGQSLSIATSDPTAHNVHGYAKANRPFNRSQPAGAANVIGAEAMIDGNPTRLKARKAVILATGGLSAMKRSKASSSR